LILSKPNSFKTFPFQRWDDDILFCVDKAIKTAWVLVQNKYSSTIMSFNEETISEKLEYELQKLMDSEKLPIFNRSKFQSVVRGGKYCSYNGVSIEKAPDLTLKLIDLNPGISDSRHDALFIECKIINRGKTPLLYIENGIYRFVEGEYAWAMPQAMMLAFVKNKKKLPTDLLESFKRNMSKKKVHKCQPKHNKMTEVIPKAPKTFLSKHVRKWVHAEYGVPGNIDILHLWLDCS
jgi:hypothetical protein